MGPCRGFTVIYVLSGLSGSIRRAMANVQISQQRAARGRQQNEVSKDRVGGLKETQRDSFVLVNFENLVQVSQFEDFHQIVINAAKTQWLVGRAALFVDQHEFADHRGGHEFHRRKVENQVLDVFVGSQANQHVAQVLNQQFVKDAVVVQFCDGHVAFGASH